MLGNRQHRPALAAQHAPHGQCLTQRPLWPAAGVVVWALWVQQYLGPRNHHRKGHVVQLPLLKWDALVR